MNFDYPAATRREDEQLLSTLTGTDKWASLPGTAQFMTWCIHNGGVRYYRPGSEIDIEYVPPGYGIAVGWYLISTHAAGKAVVYDTGPFESLKRAAEAMMALTEMHPDVIGG